MKKLVKRLALLSILAVACVCLYYLAAGYSMYQKATYSVSVTEKVTSVMSDTRYTPLEEIPDTYQKAVIATEDQRFYDHSGVDVWATGRAFVHNVLSRSFAQGGSTITQQLAKNLFFNSEKTVARKTAELYVVYELEKHYSKEEILELYLNTVYFGEGYYGIRDASEGYFGVLPNEMSEYDCTLLAGVPNAPSVYAPTKNLHLAHKRQEHVLERMVKTGAITEEKRQEILAVAKENEP